MDEEESATSLTSSQKKSLDSFHDFDLSHDRWLIIDDQLYNFGASLKDLGKRWFSFSVINDPGVKFHILSELM